MPYKVRKVRNVNRYRVKNMVTGRVSAKSTTYKKAVRQANLLNHLKIKKQRKSVRGKITSRGSGFQSALIKIASAISQRRSHI